MVGQRVRLLKKLLFSLPASFSEEQQAMRKAQVINELKTLYPALANVSKCDIEYRYEANGSDLNLVVELVANPQGQLRFVGDRYANADERSQLEGVAAVILDSGSTTQSNIYQIARAANQWDPMPDDQDQKADKKLGALSEKYRNETVSISTYRGKHQFDFPEFNTLTITTMPVSVNGLVEHASRDGIMIYSVRGGFADVGVHPPNRRRVIKVFYQNTDDALSLGMRALEAAIARRRIEMQAYVSTSTLNSHVSHFVLEGSNISIH
jgi:hypothetical protein